MKVYTLGYQGLSLDSYIETLLTANVGIVLDVREVAWSYNRKYIKSVLQNRLLESNIKYMHLPECGNPSANRKTAKTVEECLIRYKDYLRNNLQCLKILRQQIKTANSIGRLACLTCYEKFPHDCHRSILLDLLLETTKNLQVIHLMSESNIMTKTKNLTPTFWDTTAQLS